MNRQIWSFLILVLAVFGALAQEDREARGRLIDSVGRPIEGATIKVRSVTRATGTRYGENADVAAGAKSDANGLFIVRGQNPFVAVTVSVEATNYAKAVFSQIGTGADARDFKMVEGVSIIGTVVQKGAPVPKARIRLAQTEASEIFAVDLWGETDERGRFRILNAPPKRDYFLYGTMASLHGRGALKLRRVQTGATGSVVDLGEMELDGGFTVDGLIRVADAPELAAGRKVVLGRDGVDDTIEAQTDSEGRFQFASVPGEIVGIMASIPNHRLSLKNGSLFPLKTDRMLGRILTNKSGLILEFEPGTDLPALNIDSMALRQEPLLGAEREMALPHSIKVTGRVVDAETQAPIPEFTESYGRYNQRNFVDWFFTRERTQTNGVFEIYVPAGERSASIFVGAEDRMPFSSGAIEGPTNLVIALGSGIQARGQVVKPDGRPATNVMVFLAGTNETITLQGNPPTIVDQPRVRSSATDAMGRFLFQTRGDESALVIADPAGFALTMMTDLRTNRTIQLQPWARAEGKVLMVDQPLTNTMVALSSMPAPFQWYPRELPPLNVNLMTPTDANGHYVFEKAPPILVQVAYVPPSEVGNIFRRTQARRIELKAGVTERIDLGGVGRPVIGRIRIPGREEEIDWSWQDVEFETVQEGGPSDITMTNLLQTLRATANAGVPQAEHDRAEEAYQAERRGFALAAREFYSSLAGMEQLLGSRRFAFRFYPDGAFQADDVPPGKYRAVWIFHTGRAGVANPSLVANGETVFKVPGTPQGSTNAREPYDLGEIRLEPRATPKRK